MYTTESYVVTEENEDGFDAVAALVDEGERRDLFLYGASRSGKTHLLHIAKDRLGNAGMYCATTDLILRLDLGTDDAFFDRIGAVPVLLVDAFERLFEHETAPELMRLLLEERDRLGLSTAIASRAPRAEFDLGALCEPLSKFEEVELSVLGSEGRAVAAHAVAGRYRTDVSPQFSDEAVAEIAERSETVSDVENAVQFLMAGAGLGPEAVIGADDVRRLLAR